MKIFIIFLLACLTGCATANFIPSGEEAKRPSVSSSKVLIFYSVKDVPFEYQEIGRIFMDIDRGINPQPHEQISSIRNQAAQKGADAVIIQAEESTQQAQAALYGPGGGYNSFRQLRYSGIVIIKK